MFDGYELNTSLNLFTAKCDEMIGSKYILADKKISELLKCIVTNGELVGLAQECLKNFNYDVEFLRAKIPSPDGNINRYKLELPTDKIKLFAFVFCMLSEFDYKTKDLSKFLNQYFYVDGSMFEGYNEFCKVIIKPFKRTVEMLIKERDVETTKTEASERAEKYFSAEPVDMNNKVVEELILTLRDMITKIAAESSLNLTKKQEMLSVAEGLSNAIITRDARLIKILWIGFKNTFKHVKSAQKVLVRLEEKLNSYWII